jgi:hypothetical protein
MTRTDDNRRPMRVLPPAQVAGAPQPPSTAHAADRFHRTLAGARRIEPPPERLRPAAEPRVERSPVRQPPPFVAPPVLDDDVQLPPLDTTGPAAGTDTAAPRDEARAHAPRPPAIEPPAAADTGRWTEDTAQKIATLCNRADASFAHWSVTLPMDPQALPETDLVLSLSPHGLSLLFRTQSALSSRLIGAHKPRLQALLARTRGLPQDIAIEVT